MVVEDVGEATADEPIVEWACWVEVTMSRQPVIHSALEDLGSAGEEVCAPVDSTLPMQNIRISCARFYSTTCFRAYSLHTLHSPQSIHRCQRLLTHPGLRSTPWVRSSDEVLAHFTAVVQHIVHTALVNRPTLYAIPALTGVSNNGGDRINKKLQAILGALVRQYPGAEGLVKAEIANLTSGRKKGGASSKNRKDSRPAKRKRVVKKENLGDESSEQDDGGDERDWESE